VSHGQSDSPRRRPAVHHRAPSASGTSPAGGAGRLEGAPRRGSV